jgi:TonB family protein
VSSGAERGPVPAPQRRRNPIAAAIYAAILIAIASFGFGRAWDPIVATYENIRQSVAVYDATRVAFAAALKSNAADPRTLAELPHTISVYPILALRHREQGDVILRVLVGADGEVDDVRILRSSGHPQLDAAALIGVGYWFYLPAVQDHHAVASWITVEIRFRLREDASS